MMTRQLPADFDLSHDGDKMVFPDAGDHQQQAKDFAKRLGSEIDAAGGLEAWRRQASQPQLQLQPQTV